MGKMRELQMARKAANVLAIPVPKHIRRQEAKRLLAISERLRREIGSAFVGFVYLRLSSGVALSGRCPGFMSTS